MDAELADIHKLKRQSALAPARCLAHWTITQRTIHVVLPIKSAILKHGKPNLTGTVGSSIRFARKQVCLTQEQLAQTTGISRYWLGRWERNRALPNQAEWEKLSMSLRSTVKNF
jgi:DNA-binding transcriptional regulator YiaG